MKRGSKPAPPVRPMPRSSIAALAGRAMMLATALALVPFLFTPANSAELKLAARAAVLMDAHSGRLLWTKSGDLPLAPASTVKILTALVVLDRDRLEDTVVIPSGALRAPGARAQLTAGEKRTVKDLLHAMLLGSANDAAVALALHGGTTLQSFVERMNQKARALGAVRSRFKNPIGMPHADQRATAYEMALIARAALENPTLATIVAAKTYPWKTAQGTTLLKNSNRLLDSYPGAIGLKTGNTREAGYCLVAAAARGPRTIIAVVLNSGEKTVWEDASRVMDYGFRAGS